MLNLESRQDQQFDNGDLTGSTVSSNQPVVVFSGGQRALVPAVAYNPPAPSPPNDLCCTDHVEQQLVPSSALGTSYVLTRSPARGATTVPDFYRVLAIKAGTTATTSDPNFPTLTLGAGQYADLWSMQDLTLTANEPLLVGQYLASGGYVATGSPDGDPDFVLFPPVDQYLRDYLFVVAPTFSDNHVVVAAPASAGVALDGTDIGSLEPATCQRSPAGTVGGVAYAAIRCTLAAGPHSIRASEPVGVAVYSYGEKASFAYLGGLGLAQINSP